MAAIKKLTMVVIVLLFLEGTAISKVKVDLQNNFMYQSGHGGKQVADGSGNEQLTLFEPVLYLDAQVTRSTNIFGSATLDLWSSASEAVFDSASGASGAAPAALNARAAVAKAEDGGEGDDDGGGGAGTGATRKIEHRIGATLGVSQKIGTWTLTPTVGYSNEFDYHSINGSIKVEKGFAEDNFVTALRFSTFFDETHPYSYSAKQWSPWASKHTQSVDLSASQILTPDDLILFGYNLIYQDGFLAGTRNTVDVAGTRTSEVLPNSRFRHAITARYVHGLSDILALHADYRFYIDTWGTIGNSIEPSLYISFLDEAGLVKLYDRVHIQNAVKYYKNSFASTQTYMTSDSDLAKFLANETGAVLSYEWDFKGALKSFMLSGSGIYYWRTNGLKAIIAQLGVGGAF